MNVCLFLNHACNLRCSYCYNGDKFSRPMPTEVARAGVDMAVDLGLRKLPSLLTFFGGEPLLEVERMASTIHYAEQRAEAADKTLRLEVVTNGTLLEGERLDLLRKNKVFIGVSLDGCAEAQDACRRYDSGRSSHAAVSGNIRAALERYPDLPLKTISVIDPANVDYLAHSFDALLELGVGHMAMNLNYEAEWDEPARQRFEVSLQQLGERYIEAFRRGQRFRLDMLDAKIVTGVKGGYGQGDRCDFGCQEIAVAPSGRLYPCDRLVGQDDGDDVVIGDVFSGVDVARRSALISSKNAIPDDCADCDMESRCMHWCGCVNRAMTGSVGEVDGLLCWFEQRVIEQADRCAAALYQEQNPTFMQRFYGGLAREPGTR